MQFEMNYKFAYYILCCINFWICEITPMSTKRSYASNRRLMKPPTQATWNADRIVRKYCSIYKHNAYNYTKFENPIIGGIAAIKRELNCENVEPLVLGGGAAKSKELPHMVAIGYGTSINDIQWSCSGTLISDQFVLSAAHCNPQEGPKANYVRLGDVDLYNVTAVNDYARTVKITETIPHPDYKKGASTNDIILFKLSQRIPIFTAYIRPICLATAEYKVSVNAKALVSGYGYIDESSSTTGRLRKATVLVQENELCETFYESNNVDSSSKQIRFNSTLSICAGDLEEGNDTCEGDSGGPLQLQHDSGSCSYIQIGITSTGTSGCYPQNKPAIYTKVSYYIDWIQKIVWPMYTVLPDL